MAMEILGGNQPKGRPAAVFAGGKTHVFAIGAGGMMNHWTSPNGLDWQGPGELIRDNTNIVPSYPAATVVGNAVHVFAINNGGGLVRWVSPDGITFFRPIVDNAWTIPADNGIATCSPKGSNRIDAFAVTTNQGVIRYSWDTSLGTSLGSAPIAGNLPACVPAAVSSAPNVTDVFAVGFDGRAMRWRSTDSVTWTSSALPSPPNSPPGPLVRSGFTAVTLEANRIELFAVTPGGLLAHWSLDGANVTKAEFLASPTLNDSVPVAIMVGDRIEVFAIGPRPNPFTGGSLVRFRQGRSEWSAKVIGASLSAGGLGAVVADARRIDAFGLGAGGLQHWPAGIGAAGSERWANWANTREFQPIRHCRPSTEEEVVAIVRTAERIPGMRMRAVGSSWSFSDITMPSEPGVIVETNQIDGVITHVIDQSVLTENAPEARYLIHVEAGIQVEKLMEFLDVKGLAPFTMGGSSGQTLAGVISTSVHGSNWDRGPIPNAVRAIQLVGPGGTRYWIEPDQWRITEQVELRKRVDPDVQIRYDDDWFDSILVSMGSMGIITSVVIEVTDQYSLEKSCEELKWSDLEPRLDPLNAQTVFDSEHQYVMVAIDPAKTDTCYLTKHKRTNKEADAPGGWFSDPLAAYCAVDIEKVLLAFVGLPLFDSAVVPVFLAIGLPMPPPGATAGVLAIALRAGPPGTVGNFLGALFNSTPGLAAEFVSWLTRFTLKPGQSSVDVAHKIMAPVNRSECTARGLAIELAFDTSFGAHVAFVNQARALLDKRRAEGKVLGGYMALRFVGPSRAILSPQQSPRTCMIEITGVASMNSTAPLLNELEELGRLHGAIQHWGMFSIPNLTADNLLRAYPRFGTWRRVRREITNGGTIRTFENAFSARLSLDAPPAGAPLVWQQDWKWCSKCSGMAYAAGAPGRCPAGGTHEHGFSGNYGFAHNAPWVPGQRRWRWCSKCMGMTLENEFASPCPAGGAHDLRSSSEYTILRNGEADWKWCDKCQGLAFARGAPGPCPAGGLHNHPVAGSGYWLTFAPLIATSAAPSAPAPAAPGTIVSRPATGLTLRPGAGSAVQPTSGSTFVLTPVLVTPQLAPRAELPHSSPEAPGEGGWRRCSRCRGSTRAGGKCSGGLSHLHDGPRSYVIPLNAPAAPGQAHWRQCKKCETLAFRQGACFAGGVHDFKGSGDYTLRPAGQNGWRYCKNCTGLWFSGNGGQGRCPSPAGVHDPGIDDYVMVPKS